MAWNLTKLSTEGHQVLHWQQPPQPPRPWHSTTNQLTHPNIPSHTPWCTTFNDTHKKLSLHILSQSLLHDAHPFLTTKHRIKTSLQDKLLSTKKKHGIKNTSSSDSPQPMTWQHSMKTPPSNHAWFTLFADRKLTHKHTPPSTFPEHLPPSPTINTLHQNTSIEEIIEANFNVLTATTTDRNDYCTKLITQKSCEEIWKICNYAMGIKILVSVGDVLPSRQEHLSVLMEQFRIKTETGPVIASRFSIRFMSMCGRLKIDITFQLRVPNVIYRYVNIYWQT